MFLNKNEEFSDSQAVTATGATAATNILDTGAAHDIGIGEPVYLVIQVDAAVLSTAGASVQFDLVTGATTSPATVIYSSGAIAKASLTAGAQPVIVRLPAGCLRYLGVNYTVTTTSLSGGSFSAFLTKDAQLDKTYASGFAVA
jgi:hypothetical protein